MSSDSQPSALDDQLLTGSDGWRKIALGQKDEELMETIFNHFRRRGWEDVSCPLPLWFNAKDPLKVLDFGCGIGRSLHWLRKNTQWDLTGYDIPEMIARATVTPGEYIRWRSDWSTLRAEHFHVVHCSLVLQHLHPGVLPLYARDFAEMTDLVVVRGRDWLDITREKVHDLVWPILGPLGFGWKRTEQDGEHETIVYQRR